MQVKLSCDETNVPEGQLSRHHPWDRTKPGRHPVHCSWFTVDAALKLGILHDVHLAPQARRVVHNSFLDKIDYDSLSHSCLLLSAIRDVPSQTPFASALRQLPLDENEPEAQTTQSFDVAPLHVLQEGEQRVHCPPLAKLPSGQGVPVLVDC